MRLLQSLLSALRGESRSSAIPERRNVIVTGFYWKVVGLPALASSKNFTQQVVGESFYRSTIETIVGGPTVHGVNMSIAAVLRPTTYNGKPAIDVLLQDQKCGSIPTADVPDMLAELFEISPDGVASAKSRVRAGFEAGDYCIELNLKRPIAVRNS